MFLLSRYIYLKTPKASEFLSAEVIELKARLYEQLQDEYDKVFANSGPHTTALGMRVLSPDKAILYNVLIIIFLPLASSVV